jgi:hypothetical protein
MILVQNFDHVPVLKGECLPVVARKKEEGVYEVMGSTHFKESAWKKPK